ncbi:hypothetical protein CMU94_02135 [Elizabethkingia anophelis]|nr:hypothetical protein [Elizabethkingia anophelis]
MTDNKIIQAACDYLSIEGVKLIKMQAFIDGYKQALHVKPLIDNIDLVILQVVNMIDENYLYEKGSKDEEQINFLKLSVKNLNALKDFLNSPV